MLYIILLSQILNSTAELVIPTGIPSKEAKAEMEIQPVFVVAKIRKCSVQKQPTRVVPGKKSSENMQRNYRRTPMPKCDFNKVAKLKHLY